jgi:RNA polymerase sigma factor (sigma-70 family)
MTAPMLTRAGPAREALPVTELMIRARDGDKQAWDVIVERYAPLIWSICRRYQLGRADAEDVAQSVWAQLVSHLDAIRQAAALPGWLATTTRRECGRVARAARGPQAAGELDVENIPDGQAVTAEQELVSAERHAALHEALSCLSPSRQQLMALLMEDPPLSYAEISARLGIPVSSIGPTRRRCLDKLRRHPAITALIEAETGTAA